LEGGAAPFKKWRSCGQPTQNGRARVESAGINNSVYKQNTVHHNEAAIDMLDNVSSGLLAKLASEVSDLKCDCIAINDEADVQVFLRMDMKWLV